MSSDNAHEDNAHESSSLVSRRRLLALIGAGGVAALAPACGGGSRQRSVASTESTTASTSASSADVCVLTPEQTEGPYYIAGESVRYDITEAKPGMPLRLAFAVVDAAGCTPLADALVDIWHADASGNYSAFSSGDPNGTFLRGVQASDAQGRAGFKTIYPGWYQGRATHIHVKVHAGGDVVHTGQLYFDEAVSDAVYATAPYRVRTGNRTTNAQDGIYGNGGTQSTLALKRDGDGPGYVGTITLGVKRG